MCLGREIAEEIMIEVWSRSPNGYPDKKIWKTKDGKYMHVKDMTTKHIMNCLKFCDSYANDTWGVIFNQELKRRGF